MLKGEIFIKIVSGNLYLSMTTPYSFLNSKKFLNSYFTLLRMLTGLSYAFICNILNNLTLQYIFKYFV